MKDRANLEKMLFYCNKILSYTKGKTPLDAQRDSILAEACVFNLSQIGEISHRVSQYYKEKNPHIPWRSLYGLRNKIVHEYDGLAPTLICEIIFEDIPLLKRKLNKLL